MSEATISHATVEVPHWWGIVESLLHSFGLPSNSLNCLDEDDRTSLCRRLTEARWIDGESDPDHSEAIKSALVGWLRDWSESDEIELRGLVGVVRKMRGAASVGDVVVDWVREGF